MTNEENRMDENAEGRNIDYSRTNSNQEYHNLKDRYEHITPDRLDGEVENDNFDGSADNASDHPLTNTGNRISAMNRKESFLDENYGATAPRTARDILGKSENEEQDQ